MRQGTVLQVGVDLFDDRVPTMGLVRSDRVEIAGGNELAGGAQVSQVRDSPADPVKVLKGKFHSGLVGDGQQVQHCVG